MKFILKCAADKGIEKHNWEYPFPPEKDDILILDGVSFTIIRREFDTSQGNMTVYLIIEPTK